jgi:hypothetical protein
MPNELKTRIIVETAEVTKDIVMETHTRDTEPGGGGQSRQ